jgi:hypothetical protein
VNVNERRRSLCDSLPGIVQAVQVKHVKAYRDSDNHEQTSDQVEEALSALRLDRLRSFRGGCNR